MALSTKPDTPREPCPHCGTPIGLSTFMLDVNKKPTRAAFSRHVRICAEADEEKREYFRRNGEWPFTKHHHVLQRRKRERNRADRDARVEALAKQYNIERKR